MMRLFNWDDRPQTLAVRLPGAMTITDYWTEEPLRQASSFRTLSIEMPPRSARVLKGVA